MSAIGFLIVFRLSSVDRFAGGRGVGNRRSFRGLIVIAFLPGPADDGTMEYGVTTFS